MALPPSVQRVDWESLWSVEARKKQLPSLHGIVSRYTKEPDVIGMHGGLPPSNTFPFTWFQAGLLPLSHGPGQATATLPASSSGAAAAAAHAAAVGEGDTAATTAAAAGKAVQEAAVLTISDPHAVSTAQQYNMQAQGYAPLVAWARDIVTSLHRPATLQQQQDYEPVGMEVVITPGASAALDSLVRVLVNPGDPVLIEEFTYAHMAEAHLLPLGCELLPVDLDEGGLVPSHLDAVLTARQAAGQTMPKLLYLIPTGQNPTGSVMNAARMSHIYALARKWSLIIVEDDAYYWLQYPDGPDNVPGLNLRPGFLSLDVDGRVVRVDTLAKLLGPGFRLGWLSGPPPLVAKLALYMAGISIGANMVSQVMLHELLAKTWGRTGFEAFVRRLQAQYASQAAVAAAAAEQQLAGLAEWRPARAGMFMWFRLTGDLDSEALIEAAAAAKVMVVPGHLISVPHLQAAHRRKTAQQQQQQQQQGAQELLQQLQRLTLQLQQQEEGSALAAPAGVTAAVASGEVCEGAGGEGDSSGAAAGLPSIAAQLATIGEQLQRLHAWHGAGPAATHPRLPAGPAVAGAPSAAAATTAGAPSEPPHPAAAPAAASPAAAAVGAAEQQEHMPCPFFRVSFVSVPAEAIQQGFVRLRAAILSCHGPKTPPGEEAEVASCSSSVGSSGAAAASGGALSQQAAASAAASAAAAAAAAARAGGDSALC